MSAESQAKIKRVIVLSERLSEALKADIAALESGRARDMKIVDPDVQQLSLLYGREAATLNAAAVKAAPAELRVKLTAATQRFHETLARHARVLTRVRNASEGMIRAVANEVARRRTAARPYARVPSAVPRSAGAMLYNSVI
jgi:hypothetical protein